jgi:PAS domain S-box-containing protein
MVLRGRLMVRPQGAVIQTAIDVRIIENKYVSRHRQARDVLRGVCDEADMEKCCSMITGCGDRHLVQGMVEYWSKGAESTFGYASSEAMGRNLIELIVPADRIEEENRILNESVAVGVATYESMRQRKDGSLVYVDITSKAIRNEQGEIVLVISTKKDVTHLRLLRDAKTLEALRDLVESTDAIVMVNQTDVWCW